MCGEGGWVESAVKFIFLKVLKTDIFLTPSHMMISIPEFLHQLPGSRFLEKLLMFWQSAAGGGREYYSF